MVKIYGNVRTKSRLNSEKNMENMEEKKVE